MANKKKKPANKPRPAGRPAGSKAPARSARPPAGKTAQRSNRPPVQKQRNRLKTGPAVLIGGTVAVIALMVIAFIAQGGSNNNGGEPASPGSIDLLTSVPAATFEAVGLPSGPSNVNALPAGTPPVEEDGKPVVLYYGAEYCPFCAVERWPVIVALSRFGTFSGLSATTSAPPPEVLPNTPTPTFHGSSYTSDYLTLSAVETQTRTFTPLDTPTQLQTQLFSTYNVDAITGSNGGIPFVMIGNLYAWAGAQYNPSVLDGQSFDDIVAGLQDSGSELARSIGGTANYITAMICELTGGQPEDVCSTELIAQAQAALPTP